MAHWVTEPHRQSVFLGAVVAPYFDNLIIPAHFRNDPANVINENILVTTLTGCIWPAKYGNLGCGFWGLVDGWKEVVRCFPLADEDVLVIRLTCQTTLLIEAVFSGITGVAKPMPLPPHVEVPRPPTDHPFRLNADVDSGDRESSERKTGGKEASRAKGKEEEVEDGRVQRRVGQKAERVVVSMDKDGNPFFSLKCTESHVSKARMRVPKDIQELLPEEDTEVMIQIGKKGPICSVDYIHKGPARFRETDFKEVVDESGLKVGDRVKLVLTEADPDEGIKFLLTRVKG